MLFSQTGIVINFLIKPYKPEQIFSILNVMDIRTISRFKTSYVNPSRRDLLKQLMAMGCLSTTTLFSTSFLSAAEKRNLAKQELNNSTSKGDERYEALRKAMIWRVNTPKRYPDIIVQATTEAEIQECLKFASRNQLQVVCRGSGHNTAGSVLREGGMLLDISAMAEASVDVETMTADVGPGVNMHRFYQSLTTWGKVFPVAECHGVAMGGYLLGGGYPPIGTIWAKGPACYSILSADVILASGKKVLASKECNPELFWAIRGVGPGFFGVVTNYHVRIYEHPKIIMQSTFFYELEKLPNVISFLNTLQKEKDDRVEVSVALTNEPGDKKRTVAKLKIIVAVTGSPDSESEARSLLELYSTSSLSSLAKSIREYEAVEFSDLMYSPNRNLRNNSDNIWTDDANALMAIVEHYMNKPEGSTLYMTLHHGRQSSVEREDACYSSVGSHFLSSHLLWEHASDDELSKQWYAEFNRILKPYASSHYVNQVDNEHHPQRIQASFTEENWLRLGALRKKHDPDQLFYSYLGYD
ncbi:MAG: FAD-binding protein [Gammaproteobacteria bacterium]|nr:FAD-binding protein [Gammaproteobacteria bacterium]